MIRSPNQRESLSHGLCMALAVMALVLKIMIPPGFMIGQAQASGGVPIVICSGSGAFVKDLPLDPKAPPVKKADSPCAFAGNLTPLTPASSVPVLAPRAAAYVLAALPADDQAPGRGLAAPPPPATGPPRLI